jgi:hypothetical protein
MTISRNLASQALVRGLGLLAYLGLGLSILGIPYLTSVPDSKFKISPDFSDGIQHGMLVQGNNDTILCLAFYGGLLGYALWRFLREPRATKSSWLDSASLAVLIYFSIYISQVHTEWQFANGLPSYLGAPLTQLLMPADRLGQFLVTPASAFEDLVLLRYANTQTP